jgi:hypothetical protein
MLRTASWAVSFPVYPCPVSGRYDINSSDLFALTGDNSDHHSTHRTTYIVGWKLPDVTP